MLINLFKTYLDYSAYSRHSEPPLLGCVCLVLEGVITVNHTADKKRNSVVTRIVCEGELLNPEIMYAPSSDGMFTYVIESKVAIIARIPVEQFQKELTEKPEIYPLLLNDIAKALIETNQAMGALATMSAFEKVREGIAKMETAGVDNISRKRLASLAGLNITTVSKEARALGYLRK